MRARRELPEQLAHPLPSSDVTRRMRRARKHIDAPPEPWPAMPEPDLRQLALDIVDGHIIGTWMERFKRDPQLAPMVFMPLAFLSASDVETYRARGVVHVYANVRQDGHAARAVNGLPMFFSMHMLSKSDAQRLNPLVKQAAAQRRAFLRTPRRR